MNRDAWKRRIQEHPGRPQGRQHRQLDVLLALADQLDAETGVGTVSLLELVKATNTSERTVRRAIGWAASSGLLQRTARGHRLGDGTTASSGWLLLGEPQSQLANRSSQPAKPAAQPVNSRSQPVNSAQAPQRKRATRKADKTAIAEFRRWASKQPPCEHGHPGGDQVGPDGIAPCPLCRAETYTDSPTTWR